MHSFLRLEQSLELLQGSLFTLQSDPSMSEVTLQLFLCLQMTASELIRNIA